MARESLRDARFESMPPPPPRPAQKFMPQVKTFSPTGNGCVDAEVNEFIVKETFKNGDKNIPSPIVKPLANGAVTVIYFVPMEMETMPTGPVDVSKGWWPSRVRTIFPGTIKGPQP